MSCDNILLCGMGGSGISNAIAYDCFYTKSKFVKIVRSPILPKWANKRTLAIISSYSGNTAETLKMYHEAMEQKCKIVVITSGGQLKELAENNGQIAYIVPAGMDPRHAIGYMAGFIFAISRDVGCADVTEDILKIVPSLNAYVKSLERSIFNSARILAKNLIDKTTIVYYSKDVESVALRWKSQISENAKYVSFAELIDNFDETHQPVISNENAIITITTDKTITKPVQDMASKNKAYYKHISIDNEDYLEDLFKAIILGDFVSVYMAEIEGVDPRDVTPITELKKKMKSKLSDHWLDM